MREGEKNILELGRIIIWRMRTVCWISKARTHKICNIYCFSTATMVTRTRLNVTYIYIYVIPSFSHGT